MALEGENKNKSNNNLSENKNKSRTHLHLPIMCWASLDNIRRIAIYRHVTRDVKSCASKTGKNIRVYGHHSMIRVLNDSRDWALTASVGRLFRNLMGRKQTCKHSTRYLWLCPLV